MKIIIAPDSFKGSLSSIEVADAVEKGIKAIDSSIEIVKIPMADGGEGTVESLINYSGGEIVHLNVSNPLGDKITAYYGLLGDGKTAIMEMARASGLPLIPEEKRNPLKTTTFGTGELIRDALDKGCKKIIIGIGGSATVDCGSGMAQALGVKFYDKNSREITEKMTGGLLTDVERIDLSDLDKRIADCEVIVACDVYNPLLGEQGAARVYAPQKGATPEQVVVLEKNLNKFSSLIKKDVGKDIVNESGSGAAGGLGAGLMAFLNARLGSGIKLILDTVRFEDSAKDADLIITGEGRIDVQTAYGKVIAGIAKIAKKHSVPVVAICGTIEGNLDELYKIGVTSIFSITDKPMPLNEAIGRSAELIEDLSKRIVLLIKGIESNE